MLLRAASEHDLDLSISAMIGDKFSDLEAAERAGCPIRILVRTGHGTDEIGSASPSSVEHLVADDILDAVKLLISSPDGPSPNPDSMESAE
jgi:D-glycero-D-manno-heptose 1,7-bisphosphate phosphatase